jgi:hypothetical protein
VKVGGRGKGGEVSTMTREMRRDNEEKDKKIQVSEKRGRWGPRGKGRKAKGGG